MPLSIYIAYNYSFLHTNNHSHRREIPWLRVFVMDTVNASTTQTGCHSSVSAHSELLQSLHGDGTP